MTGGAILFHTLTRRETPLSSPQTPNPEEKGGCLSGLFDLLMIPIILAVGLSLLGGGSVTDQLKAMWNFVTPGGPSSKEDFDKMRENAAEARRRHDAANAE